MSEKIAMYQSLSLYLYAVGIMGMSALSKLEQLRNKIEFLISMFEQPGDLHLNEQAKAGLVVYLNETVQSDIESCVTLTLEHLDSEENNNDSLTT